MKNIKRTFIRFAAAVTLASVSFSSGFKNAIANRVNFSELPKNTQEQVQKESNGIKALLKGAENDFKKGDYKSAKNKLKDVKPLLKTLMKLIGESDKELQNVEELVNQILKLSTNLEASNKKITLFMSLIDNSLNRDKEIYIFRAVTNTIGDLTLQQSFFRSEAYNMYRKTKNKEVYIAALASFNEILTEYLSHHIQTRQKIEKLNIDPEKKSKILKRMDENISSLEESITWNKTGIFGKSSPF